MRNQQKTHANHSWRISILGAISVWILILFSPGLASLIWFNANITIGGCLHLVPGISFSEMFHFTEPVYHLLSNIEMTIWNPVFSSFGYEYRAEMLLNGTNSDPLIALLICISYGAVIGTVGALFQVWELRQQGVILSPQSRNKLITVWVLIFAIASQSYILFGWWVAGPADYYGVSLLLYIIGSLLIFPVIIPIPILFYLAIGVRFTRRLRRQARLDALNLNENSTETQRV